MDRLVANPNPKTWAVARLHATIPTFRLSLAVMRPESSLKVANRPCSTFCCQSSCAERSSATCVHVERRC